MGSDIVAISAASAPSSIIGVPPRVIPPDRKIIRLVALLSRKMPRMTFTRLRRSTRKTPHPYNNPMNMAIRYSNLKPLLLKLLLTRLGLRLLQIFQYQTTVVCPDESLPSREVKLQARFLSLLHYLPILELWQISVPVTGLFPSRCDC